MSVGLRKLINWGLNMPTNFQILPGVLAYSEQDFKQRLLHPGLNKIAKTFHVDILDGSMFHASCWAEPKIIGSWSGVPQIELHCMVSKPLKVIEAWYTHVPSVKRVIIHKEIGNSLTRVLQELDQLELEAVVAVNPNTPVDTIVDFEVDGLLIMGVEPGKSGQPFLGETILAKLKRAKRLMPDTPLELDGGASDANIRQIMLAGATRAVASSALWKAENPVEAYENLLAKLA